MRTDSPYSNRPAPDSAPDLDAILRSIQAERRCSVEEALEIMRRDHSDQVRRAQLAGTIHTRVG